MTVPVASTPSNAELLSVSLSNATLTLAWSDMKSTLNGATLRAACRCAQCRFERRKTGMADDAALPLAGDDRIAISGVSSMGYGLQIKFSDGHNRGIYPWAYLRELVEFPGCANPPASLPIPPVHTPR